MNEFLKSKWMVFFLFMLFVGMAGCASGKKPVTKTQQGLQWSGEVVNQVRVIKLEAKKYEFIPNPIVVQEGEKVRLEATSTDVNHGLAIPGYKINQELPAHKTEVIEFMAYQSGTFATHCSEFCGMGHMGMRGELVVLPKKQ
jgi:cytochrome c oxidase subunit II